MNEEDIRHQRKLLRIHRNTARILSQQLSILTAGFAPPWVVSGMQEALENIRRVKGALRSWEGETVDDEAIDSFDISPFIGE